MFNYKSTLKTLLAMIILTVTLPAMAHTPDPSRRFAGYDPTVLENETKVNEIFDGLETRFKMPSVAALRFKGSQCTQRAETWSYDLSHTMGLKLQKVFVFYTAAYHQWYRANKGKKFNWWFHVSPYLLAKDSQGQVVERVIDRSFADQPQTMKEWTDLFVESGEPCIENVPFAEFEGDLGGEGPSYNRAAHCYIVRAPMFDLFPESIDARERGEKTGYAWDMSEVRYGAKALTSRARDAFLARVGL